MRILLVHNRYRSGTPSGENRAVDEDGEALAALGHEVMRFGRSSDEIEQWPLAKKASLPARIIWSRESHRDLKAVLREYRPEVVHVHNTFPLLSASVLYACRDARVPVVATLHNYKLVCANGMFFRRGTVCHDCTRGLTVRAVVHGCYRGSHAATVPVALAKSLHGQAWRSLYLPTYSTQQHSVTCTGGSASRPTAYSSDTAASPAAAGHGRRGRRLWSMPDGWTRPRECAC